MEQLEKQIEKMRATSANNSEVVALHGEVKKMEMKILTLKKKKLEQGK